MNEKESIEQAKKIAYHTLFRHFVINRGKNRWSTCCDEPRIVGNHAELPWGERVMRSYYRIDPNGLVTFLTAKPMKNTLEQQNIELKQKIHNLQIEVARLRRLIIDGNEREARLRRRR